MDALCSFNCGLGMELGWNIILGLQMEEKWKRAFTWVRNLEQNILHNVATIRTLEFKLIAFEQDIVEAPNWSRKNSRNARLALHDLQNKVHSPLASIASSPRLPRHGVGRVSICPQTLTINPSLRNRIRRLLLRQTQQLGNHSSTGNLDQHNMVQPDFVERV